MKNKSSDTNTEAKRKKIAIIGLAAVLAVLIALSVVFSGRILAWAKDPMSFRMMAAQQGLRARVIFILLFAAQILLAFIPGEPLEILAGVAFGTWHGLALVLIGVWLGATISFLLIKRFGRKFTDLFIEREKLEALPIMNNRKRLYGLMFLLYFIPGTPKDILNYAAPLTGIEYLPFIVLSTLARVPSVITSTLGGNELTSKRLDMAILIFGITAIISIVGVVFYRHITKKREK
ncbi:MAG: VTT domain-containing protein [Oscillospiraceae bacterium]|nr:VTT domain-containing protein [Oscillospiraceae bacterium]